MHSAARNSNKNVESCLTPIYDSSYTTAPQIYEPTVEHFLKQSRQWAKAPGEN
jgi:hypothetical protein